MQLAASGSTVNEPSTTEQPINPPQEWLAGGGKMAEVIQSMDWSQTPLGPIALWPPSPRTTVSLCLASNFPISLAWGAEPTQIYNDGYWPICGEKHPHAMGQNFRLCLASRSRICAEAHVGTGATFYFTLGDIGMTSEETIIFLVEDNDEDAELALRAFHRAKIANPLIRARDGADALDYLFARGKYAGRDVADLPVVTLLDLNLPKISGLEVLKAIRANERTRHLPVVILTTSNEDKDRLQAYDAHANSYVLKPVDYDQFVTAAAQLTHYWTNLNTPPPREEIPA